MESDPRRLQERHNDSQNSFLEVYRSLNSNHVGTDETIVTRCVELGVVPEQLRYGIMRGVNRGVVKAVTGAMFYFNHVPSHPDAEKAFKITPVSQGTTTAIIQNREWEAGKLLKTCNLGCDMLKRASVPPSDAEELDKAPETGTIPIDEERYMQGQQRMLQERHPGAAGGGTTPDRPEVGRDWHQPLRRGQERQTLTSPADGLPPVASNDGQKHWSAAGLIKSYGEQLQASAPQARPQLTQLEVTFATEVLGKSQSSIDTGQVSFSPHDQRRFHQWRTNNLRSRLTSPLQKWLK